MTIACSPCAYHSLPLPYSIFVYSIHTLLSSWYNRLKGVTVKNPSITDASAKIHCQHCRSTVCRLEATYILVLSILQGYLPAAWVCVSSKFKMDLLVIDKAWVDRVTSTQVISRPIIYLLFPFRTTSRPQKTLWCIMHSRREPNMMIYSRSPQWIMNEREFMNYS